MFKKSAKIRPRSGRLLAAAGVTLLIALLSFLYFLQAGPGGVRLECRLGDDPAAPADWSGQVERLQFHRAEPLPLHPRGGGFSLRARAFLYPPQKGRYSLALVTLGRASIRLGQTGFETPPLGQTPWPRSWRVGSQPREDTGNLRDRDLQTRWSTGRPKKQGDRLWVEFPLPQRLHGVVMDSAPSGMRDCPLRFQVSTRASSGLWTRVADVNVDRMIAATVDAFFSPSQGDRLEIKTLGSHNSFYWSVHELYVISDSLLNDIAFNSELDGPAPLEINYLPPEEERAGSVHEVERDYGLLMLYWKPPGQNWQPVPASALGGSPRPAPWSVYLHWLLSLGGVLPWLWILAAFIWLVILLPKSGGNPAPEGAQVNPLRCRIFYIAAALLALIALDDLLGLSGVFRFWSSMWFGPAVQVSLYLRFVWAGAALFLLFMVFGFAYWRDAGDGLFTWALAGFLCLQAALFLAWLQALGLQAPLTSNDHGGFIYSHAVWQRTLLPFTHYNPFWNAGILEWEPVRNGSFSAFALTRPLTWFLPLKQAYTLFTPLIFVLVLPWVVFASLRGLGVGAPGSLFGAFCALLPHSNWVFWLAMGANAGLISATLSLPALAGFWRLMERRGRAWLNIIWTAASFCLALFWMPFAIAAAPACLALVIIHYRDLKGTRLKQVLLLAGLTLLISLPWLLDFLRHFAVLGFTQKALHTPHISLWGTLLGIFNQIGEINPLLLLPGLAGLPFMEPKKRTFIIVYVVWLLLVITLLHELAPGYQLNRMQQLLALIWVVPAAILWDCPLRAGISRTRLQALAVAALALSLALQSMAALNFYSLSLGNRVPNTAPPTVLALANHLAQEREPQGRILLAGRTHMDYGGSSAYLQLITNREMICDYHVATLQDDLEVKLPPQLCRQPPTPAEYKRLLSLYNVSQVVVDLHNDGPWKLYLAGLDYLEPILTLDKRFRLYRTHLVPGWSLKGYAEVEADFDRIRVTPEKPGELILKYRFQEGMRASGSVRLEPDEVWPGVNFIKCSQHQGKPFTISY